MELAPAILLGSLAVSALFWATAHAFAKPQRALALKILATALLLTTAQLWFIASGGST